MSVTGEPISIVGGGLAGGIAALTLAKGGRNVTLFEKELAPKAKVCGEFLSAESIELLRNFPELFKHIASLDPANIRNAIFSVGRRQATFPLPKECWGIERQDLDGLILNHAIAAGAQVNWDCKVQSLDDLRAQGPVILATGKHNFPGLGRVTSNDASLVRIGLKQHFVVENALPEDLAHQIHLFFFHGGYGGFVSINANRVSLAIAIEKKAFQHLGSTLSGVLSHVRQSDPLVEQWLSSLKPLGESMAIGQVPYGYRRVHAIGPEIYSVGDQAAVIPSFSGDGMSIALASGYASAQAILNGVNAETFQNTLAHELAPNVKIAHLFSSLVERPRIMSLGLPLLHIKGLGNALFKATRTRLSAEKYSVTD